MPMYNKLCPACGHETEELVSFETFEQHNENTPEKCIECPACKAKTAYYSLTRLKKNLKADLDTYQPVYIRASSTMEKYWRGFQGFGSRT